MVHDLKQLLRETADRPVHSIDTARVVRTGRRRRHAKRAGAFVVGVAVLTGVVLVGASLLPDRRGEMTVTAPGGVDGPPLDGPSAPSLDTSEGTATVELVIEPRQVTPEAFPSTMLVNRGDVPVYAWRECSLAEWDGARWWPIPQPLFNDREELEPGESLDEGGACFDTPGLGTGIYGQSLDALSPGWYQVRWQVHLDAVDRRPLMQAYGSFEVFADEEGSTDQPDQHDPARPPASCPVTIPEGDFMPLERYHSGFAEGAWYGSDDLWVILDDDGSVWRPFRGELGKPKLFLWSVHQGRASEEPQPDVRVTAERIDGEAPEAHNEGSTHGWVESNLFMLTSITLPTPGCWEITAEYRDASLSWVIWATDTT
ncbi:MAG: hypothetical protein ACRDUY_00700 [Nitriliruptorales bacterium]